MTPEALAVVGGIATLALLAVGALAFQVYGLAGRVEKLEKAREVERRHREHLAWRLDGEPRDDEREWRPVWRAEHRPPE
jgi:hypothetical protein